MKYVSNVCQYLTMYLASYSFFKRFVAIKIAVFDANKVRKDLSTFSTNSPCQLDVFWHDSYTFCVDGAQVGVFEESN